MQLPARSAAVGWNRSAANSIVRGATPSAKRVATADDFERSWQQASSIDPTSASNARKAHPTKELTMRSLPLANMLLAITLLFVGPTLQTGSHASALAEDGEFTPLFNGKNLDGWVPVNTAESTWSVKEGMLICNGKPTGEIRTPRMYQNFILEVEWRHMKPRGNAGIFVWADDITSRGVPFHRSIEVQVLENAYGNTRGYTTHGDIFPIHGAKMTPVNGRGGSRAFPTENRSRPTPEWNHYRIECRDGSITLAVNGKVVTRGNQCSPSKGYICIESEGGVVHYRNMRILELPDTPVDDQDVAIADRGFRSLYNGVDLNDWQSEGAWSPQDWVLKAVKGGWIESRKAIQAEAFIFDVRAKDTPTLKLMVSGQTVSLSLDAPEVARHLAKPGGWNRFSGTLENATLHLQVNDKPLPAIPIVDVTSSRLRLETSGPADFANIYVRSATKAAKD